MKQESRVKMRSKLNLNDNFVLGYLGKLVDYYNLSILPEIIKNLNEDPTLKDFKFSLIIMGDGPYKSQLEKIISQLNVKNVVFTGSISYETIEDYYSSLDLFIFPLDSIAIKLGEVLSMGIPIVVQKGMAEDWIKNEENGLISENKFTIGFVEAIKRFCLLENETKLQKNI